MKKILIGIAATLTILPMFAFAQVGDVAPATTSKCVSITHDLQYRSRDAQTGGDVSTLQDFLQSQGYLNSEPTGYFGLLTQSAVKSYQKANGILNSGYFGPITRGKLVSALCAGNNSNGVSSTNNTNRIVNSSKTALCPNGMLLSNNCKTATICAPGVLYNSATGALCTTSTAPKQPTIYFFVPLTSNVNTGQSDTLSWNVVNANRCVLQYGSSEENVALISSKTVYPTQTTSYKLWCVNDPGTGKDGPSAERTTSITVIPSSSTQQSINLTNPLDGHLWTIGDNQVINWTSSGIASNVIGHITLRNTYGTTYTIPNVPNTGSYRWSSVGTINGSVIPAGRYAVQVTMDNLQSEGIGTLTIATSASTPTCSLTSDRLSYTLGDTITYSWTSQNATYASWQQDTSGKDHLWLPGDKLSANSSQQVSASVIGNPTATLLATRSDGKDGLCSKTVNIAAPSSATIDIVSPQANAGYTRGTNTTIKWSTYGISSGAKIYVDLVGPDGTIYHAATNLANDTTSETLYHISTAQPEGIYSVKVCANEINGKTWCDVKGPIYLSDKG